MGRSKDDDEKKKKKKSKSKSPKKDKKDKKDKKKDKKDKSKSPKKDKKKDKKDKSKSPKKDKKKDKKDKSKSPKKDKKKKDKSKSPKKDKKKDESKSPKKSDSKPDGKKADAEAARETQAEQLRRGLALKKRVIECWERVTKDPTGKKHITSPEMLLEVLNETGMFQHAGQRRTWRIADGRQVSMVHLQTDTKTEFSKMLFGILDLDGNKSVEMNELLLVLDVISNPDKKERARFNFTLMDLDGNGKLDRSELKRLLQLTFMGAQVALELELASRPEIVVNEHDSKIVHRLFSDPKVLSHSIDELVSAADLDKDGFVQEAEYVAWIENEKAIEKFQKFVSAKIEHSAIENAELAKLVAESFQNLLNFF